jgi:cellulose synthase operon protein C
VIRSSGRRNTSLALLLLLLPTLACAQQQDGSAAEAALNAGRYEEAIRIGQASGSRGDLLGQRTLIRALLEVGRYDEAAEAAIDFPNLRGEALRARGRNPEAEAAFRAAIEADGPDRLSAEINLAELLLHRGLRDEAHERLDRFFDYYNRSTRLSSEDLTAVALAVQYLGAQEPQLFQDAVKAFDEAIAENPRNIEPHVRLGELFLEKYNSPEATTALNDALGINPNHPRALLGLARTRAFDGDRNQAVALARQSLEHNPNLVSARVYLARLMLDGEDAEGAETELTQALEVNPNSLEALSTLAALHWTRGDQRRFDQVVARVGELNPTYAGLQTTVAEIAAQQRRYAEAARLAEAATRLDPGFWPAFAVLGLNQFRVGQIDQARASLERSFAGDPYNVWIKNNLDLLDTFSEYESRSVPGFEFMLHRTEADLLFPYLAELAEEAHRDLAQRYGDVSRGTIRIELYPRSADFSVRTVGLSGLGALGVSFGDVLALDSPAARRAGTFNWATTLWHEMAHAVTLGVSGNRVPRWLTEGLSVLEERRARPEWGSTTTPEFVMTYAGGELPPVSRLNEGFMRPPSPQHLGHAYHLASLVAEWVEETRGFDALVRMLHGYRDGRSSDDVLRRVLGAEPEQIDAEFAAWIAPRVRQADAAEYFQLLTAGRTQLSEGDLTGARRSLEAAAALFPIGGGGSPHALLAQIHQRNGDKRSTADALLRLTAVDENAYEANLQLAALLEELGDRAGAAAALERAVWIHPYDAAPHVRLAELYTELGVHDRAVRERRALVALRPVDRAEALYNLAEALFAAGDRAGARQEVLKALEAAPAFERAQQLLLRLHEQT